MIQIVEEPSNVGVNHPPSPLPNSGPNTLPRLMRVALGSKPEGHIGEIRFKQRFEDHLRRGLHNPITYTRHAEVNAAKLEA